MYFMLLGMFYSSPKKLCYVKYYDSVFISCSGDVMLPGIFYASISKHCHVSVILSHGSIFST